MSITLLCIKLVTQIFNEMLVFRAVARYKLIAVHVKLKLDVDVMYVYTQNRVSLPHKKLSFFFFLQLHSLLLHHHHSSRRLSS